MLLTYAVQVHVEAPNGGDEEDEEYKKGCDAVEEAIQGLPGYRSHDLEDESDD